MELTNLQKNMVDQLLELFDSHQKVKVDFKAPTGSGKTLMASAFISELIECNPTEKFVFVVATPSAAELPFSFEQKLLQYKQNMRFSDFIVEYVKSPSENAKKSSNIDGNIKIIPERNGVYIFGKSSFGKDRILTTRHVIDDFVTCVIDSGFKLIYIRDEAHIGGQIGNTSNFESLMQNNADYVIKMTATPDYSDASIKKVVLSEDDLNNPLKNDGKYLLKTKPIVLLQNSISDMDLLKDSISNFKKIKAEYRELEKENIYIRPAMLIQVENDSNTDIEKSIIFNSSLENIKNELNSNGLSWVQYFGGDNLENNRNYNVTLNEISRNDSDIDVIIFKLGPSTGWDIPRACMLVQLRSVCSEGLNIQTIGRIKRNCYPNLEKNSITDKYYIYSNKNPQDHNLIVFNAKVKDKFKNEEFMAIDITNIKDCSKKVSENKLKEDLVGYLQTNKNKIIQSISDCFDKNDKGIIYKDFHNSIIYTEVTNVFDFINIYKKAKQKESDLFEKCEKVLQSFWSDNLKDINIHGYKCSKEMFFMTLILRFRNDIANLINKNKQYLPKYDIVSSVYSPDSYVEMYSQVPHAEKTMMHSYLFDTSLNNEDFLQPLGETPNSPEVIVFNKISSIDYKYENIKVWAKNFTTSNVNSAYLDKYNNLRHSYFDFVIKFKNNALLYIEVKGEKDIDPEKTNTLKGAYQDYFNKERKSVFDKPVVISIFKVDTNKKTITHESFYDESLFSKDLKTLNVDELINEISTMKLNKV